MWNNKLALIAVLLCLAFDAANAACTINVNGDLGEPQPLLIRPGTNQFFYPSGSDGIIRLNDNQQIELYCSASWATPSGIAANSITLTCYAGNTFSYNGIVYPFSEFTCSSYPEHTARKTGASCYNNSAQVEVGFVVGTRFLQQMTLCHNEVTEETYYAKYKFTPANKAFQSGFPRPNFITYTFFGGKNVDNLYTRVVHRETIAKILSSTERAEYYIHPTNDFYFARGHLAAKADFIFGNQHRATFYFVNVAPQWQRFNGLNWEAIEDSTRQIAAARNIELDVYTGTFGRMHLTDDNGSPHEIHFYVNVTTRQIPVPKFFYKILINQADDAGIVLIGINQIYLTLEEIKRDYIICNDISNQITWSLNWQRETIDRGYSYACSVNDFVHAVPHLSLSASRLLV